MATPIPDPSGDADKSWRNLVARARNESAPPAIDVQLSVRAAIESGPRIAAVVPRQEPNLWSDLAALTRLSWMRLALAGSAVASGGLFFAGVSALRKWHEVVEFAGPLVAGL